MVGPPLSSGHPLHRTGGETAKRWGGTVNTMNIDTLHHRPLKDVHPFLSKHYRYAVVGASANPEKYGNIVFMDLKNAGFMVIPVNPKLETLAGMKALKNLQESKPPVDVAVFV